MSTIKPIEKKESILSNDWIFCIVSVWIAVYYSVIIQYKYIQISNGMLIFGLFVLATFMFTWAQKVCEIRLVFTSECLWMLAFMIYMLLIGYIASYDTARHMKQWTTSLEYMFMTIVISSVIMNLGTDSFHIMLLSISIVLAIVFLKDPVLYVTGGRYSISKEVNPNGLGMSFTTGVWVILYLQQKRKMPLLISLATVVLLIYCIFKTGSRKALIAAGIIIFLWYVLGYLPNVMKMKSKAKIAILLFSALLLTILVEEFLHLYSGSDIEARMGGLDDEVSGGLRSSMYKNGWALFKAHPLFGLGFQGYSYYYRIYSHATLVEVPVSGGIFGSFLYFVPYYTSIKKCIKLYKYCKQHEGLSVHISEIKMIIILWIAMLFYCTVIIHPYQFDSFIIFGIIFGQTSFIERKILLVHDKDNEQMEKKCKWIR